MTRSDVQLMLDVKAGDDRSFDLLLQKYRTPLVNFLYRMVRDTATGYLSTKRIGAAAIGILSVRQAKAGVIQPVQVRLR